MIKNLVVFFIFLLTPVLALADWAETPVAINSNVSSTDPHLCSGKRIVAYSTSIFTLAAEGTGGNSVIYRSTNGGSSWTSLEDYTASGSGSLVVDSDGTIYYFFKSGSSIYMARFEYDASPPSSATAIDTGLSASGLAAYDVVWAGIDEDEYLYVTYSQSSSIYVIVSSDGGDNWGTPVELSSGLSSLEWYYGAIEATDDNTMVVSYTNLSADGSGYQQIYMSYSTDHGASWTRRTVSTGSSVYNPVILPISGDEIWMFAQKRTGSDGLAINKSTDLGQNWDGWSIVEDGWYADPGAALLSNGDVFVIFRDGTSSGSDHREKAVLWDDSESSWSTVKDYSQSPYSYERPATRSAAFFQTFHNGGSDLFWTWMQYDNSGANRDTYFDSNPDLSLMEVSSGGGVSVISVGGSGSVSFGGAN